MVPFEGRTVTYPADACHVDTGLAHGMISYQLLNRASQVDWKRIDEHEQRRQGKRSGGSVFVPVMRDCQQSWNFRKTAER